MASTSSQQRLPALLVKAVDRLDEPAVNEVDTGELSMELAQKLAGELVCAVLHETQMPMKALGDKGLVSRWASGEQNPNLAKLIQRQDARKSMAKALLKSCDDYDVIEEFRVVPKRRER